MVTLPMSARRVAAILADEDFVGLVARVKAQLTQKVMAATTSPEDRIEALAEYRGIERIVAAMRSDAYTVSVEDK